MWVYSLLWLIILIGLIITELATMNLVAIWFIPAALVSLILSLFNVHLVWQIVAFIVISISLLIATRPLAKKFTSNKQDKKTNVDAVIDAEGYVTKTIDNAKEQGEARVNGMTWTARSDNNATVIEEGSKIIVVRIDGVKAICKKID